MISIAKTKRGRPKRGDGPCTRLKWLRCECCDASFFVARTRSRSHWMRHRKFCSEDCRNRAAGAVDAKDRCRRISTLGVAAAWKTVESLPKRQCSVCGDMFKPATFGRHRYCSSQCKVAMDNARRSRYRAGAKQVAVSYKVIYQRDAGRCQLCGKKVSAKHKWPNLLSGSMDHIVPLSKGGEHVESNIQLAHLGCNLSKNNKYAGQLRLF